MWWSNKTGARVHRCWTKNILFPWREQVRLLVEVCSLSLVMKLNDSASLIGSCRAQTYPAWQFNGRNLRNVLHERKGEHFRVVPFFFVEKIIKNHPKKTWVTSWCSYNPGIFSQQMWGPLWLEVKELRGKSVTYSEAVSIAVNNELHSMIELR